MNLLKLKVLRWIIISIMIVQVLCDTKSKDICGDNSVTLQVKIKTGDVLFAGTDSHVSLLLRSDNGIICQVYDLDNDGNDRERNGVDEYVVCCPKGFLNDENELSMLAMVQLSRIGAYGRLFANDWFIERVEVRANERLLLNYRFYTWTSPLKKLIFGVSKVNNDSYIPF